jgi:hypothetical protein
MARISGSTSVKAAFSGRAAHCSSAASSARRRSTSFIARSPASMPWAFLWRLASDFLLAATLSATAGSRPPSCS